VIETKRARWNRMTMTLRPLRWGIAAGAVAVVAFIIALGFYISYDRLNEYFMGVATNTGAGFLDVLLVVVGFGCYEQRRRRNDGIARLRERIEDVKRFDDPRAHSTLGAAIRGLARFGLTDIDLRGAHLTGFSFSDKGIRSIAGAVISDGLYTDDEMKNFAKLCSVDFTDVNCNGVCFGNGNLSLATLIDCNFRGAKLIAATFDGSSMRWSIEKVVIDEAGWEEFIDEAEDGSSIYARTYAPAFEMADLTDCSFKGVQFQNADFRGARNVGKANFDAAKGLETLPFRQGAGTQAFLAEATTCRRRHLRWSARAYQTNLC
jgi:uncharacterized protein YjbI with pentapeptide repeats